MSTNIEYKKWMNQSPSKDINFNQKFEWCFFYQKQTKFKIKKKLYFCTWNTHPINSINNINIQINVINIKTSIPSESIKNKSYPKILKPTLSRNYRKISLMVKTYNNLHTKNKIFALKKNSNYKTVSYISLNKIHAKLC